MLQTGPCIKAWSLKYLSFVIQSIHLSSLSTVFNFFLQNLLQIPQVNIDFHTFFSMFIHCTIVVGNSVRGIIIFIFKSSSNILWSQLALVAQWCSEKYIYIVITVWYLVKFDWLKHLMIHFCCTYFVRQFVTEPSCLLCWVSGATSVYQQY